MKLRVVINDSLAAAMHYQYTGGQMEIVVRFVDVELTDEQIGKLALRKLGMDGGKPYYETIEKACLINK